MMTGAEARKPATGWTRQTVRKGEQFAIDGAALSGDKLAKWMFR